MTSFSFYTTQFSSLKTDIEHVGALNAEHYSYMPLGLAVCTVKLCVKMLIRTTSTISYIRTII